MDDRSEPLGDEKRAYEVPTYRSSDTAAWYHFLHGNVPGHQIDFLYRPEVPQGPLTRQHFSHLARLMKYIEPPMHSEYAFAVGNLSRDDTQYEPGHGGLSLIFGFRLRGATDHTGRRDPPFAHAIATADRAMDCGTLLAASEGLYRRLFDRGIQDGPSIRLYREYVRCAAESPERIVDALREYTASFGDLPRPGPSAAGLRWQAGGAQQPKRIGIVYPDNAPFSELAQVSVRIAAMLSVSDIRWTAITSGREADVPDGVTVRLVAARDAAMFEQGGGPILGIEEVPLEEGEIAQKLFGARSAAVRAAVPGGAWRERHAPVVADSSEAALTAPAAIAGKVNEAERARSMPTDSNVSSSAPRRNIYLGVFAAASALAAAAYFGFMSGPPRASEAVNPGVTVPPPPPSPPVTAVDSPPAPTPAMTSEPAEAPPTAMPEPTPAPPTSTSTGKRSRSGPSRIFNDEPTSPAPKVKPTKPPPKSSPPSALGNQPLF